MHFRSREFFKKLIFLGLTLACLGCRPLFKSPSATDANGSNWADGSAALSALEEPYQLYLMATGPVEGLDTRRNYGLFATKKSDGPEGERHPVIYVDWEKSDKQTLRSYTYALEVTLNPVNYNVLLKFPHTMISLNEIAQKVAPGQNVDLLRAYIGSGSFTQRIAPIIADGSIAFNLARLSSGNKDLSALNPIAIHFIEKPPLSIPGIEECQSSPTKVCQVVPLISACSNKLTTAADCRPQAISPQEQENFRQLGEVSNASRLDDGSYLLKDTGALQPDAATLVFVAQDIASDEHTNQNICSDQVALQKASAFDNRDNPACIINAEPSPSSKNSKLACRYSVLFKQPLDIADYSCRITATFRTTGKRQSLVIIYQST